MVDTLDIKQNLLNIGLNEDESQIFLAMSASIRPYSITELAYGSKIPRTTVYRICESLVNKNIAHWVVGIRSKKIQPINPANLDQLIHVKETEFNQIVKSISNLKDALKPQLLVPETQVRYYKGKEGMKQLIWNTLKAKGETVGYTTYERTKIVGKEFSKAFIVEFTRRKLVDRTIINPRVIDIAYEKLATFTHQMKNHIRVLEDKDYYISGDTYIYNNVYAVNFWHENEVVGVEIENPEIARIQKGIFEVLWKISKPLKFELDSHLSDVSKKHQETQKHYRQHK